VNCRETELLKTQTTFHGPLLSNVEHLRGLYSLSDNHWASQGKRTWGTQDSGVGDTLRDTKKGGEVLLTQEFREIVRLKTRGAPLFKARRTMGDRERSDKTIQKPPSTQKKEENKTWQHYWSYTYDDWRYRSKPIRMLDTPREVIHKGTQHILRWQPQEFMETTGVVQHKGPYSRLPKGAVATANIWRREKTPSTIRSGRTQTNQGAKNAA